MWYPAARDVQAKFLLRNGADEVVYPEKQLAAWTAIRYSADHIFDYVELDEEHAIFEVAVPEGWAEKTIGQLNVRRKYNINIMALKHDGKMKLNISPDTVLPAEDTMLVLGNIRVPKVFPHLKERSDPYEGSDPLCLVLASFYGSWRFMGKADVFFDSLEFPDQDDI